jgi:hypothetical protein
MATHTSTSKRSASSPPVGTRNELVARALLGGPGSLWPWRLVAGALLLLSSGVHLYLYAAEQYHEIPTVGPLFIMTGVVAVVLAGVVVVVRRPLGDLVGAAFALSVLGGYLLTLYLPNGLFLFKEPGISYSGAESIIAEAGAALSLLVVSIPPLWKAGRSGAR